MATPALQTVAATARPEAATTAFASAVNRGDLEAAANCFSRDACLITPDSTAVNGRGEIRSILHQLIALETRIEIRQSSLLRAGDVALGFESWVVSSAGADGSQFSRALTPTLVLRRVEGDWKLAVAMPWAKR